MCQILFSRKNMASLSSAESAHSMISIQWLWTINEHSSRCFFFYYYFFVMSFGVFCLFHHESICCGYSLELSQWSTSNEYSKHIFLWINQEKVYLDIPFIWSYAAWLLKIDNMCDWTQILIKVRVDSGTSWPRMGMSWLRYKLTKVRVDQKPCWIPYLKFWKVQSI